MRWWCHFWWELLMPQPMAIILLYSHIKPSQLLNVGLSTSATTATKETRRPVLLGIYTLIPVRAPANPERMTPRATPKFRNPRFCPTWPRPPRCNTPPRTRLTYHSRKFPMSPFTLTSWLPKSAISKTTCNVATAKTISPATGKPEWRSNTHVQDVCTGIPTSGRFTAGFATFSEISTTSRSTNTRRIQGEGSTLFSCM